MHHELRSEIEIDATPEAVWQVLTDLERYAVALDALDIAVGTTAARVPRHMVADLELVRLRTEARPELASLGLLPEVLVAELGDQLAVAGLRDRLLQAEEARLRGEVEGALATGSGDADLVLPVAKPGRVDPNARSGAIRPGGEPAVRGG